MGKVDDRTQAQNPRVMRRVPSKTHGRKIARQETFTEVGWRAVCGESRMHGSEGGQGFLWVRLSYPTFDARFRRHPLPTDTNMQKLWQSFEHYLLTKFPQATTLATLWNDPSAQSIDEYQAFLKTLGYFLLAQGAFGKRRRAT
jgi:hypothetical protein